MKVKRSEFAVNAERRTVKEIDSAYRQAVASPRTSHYAGEANEKSTIGARAQTPNPELRNPNVERRTPNAERRTPMTEKALILLGLFFVVALNEDSAVVSGGVR